MCWYINIFHIQKEITPRKACSIVASMVYFNIHLFIWPMGGRIILAIYVCIHVMLACMQLCGHNYVYNVCAKVYRQLLIHGSFHGNFSWFESSKVSGLSFQLLVSILRKFVYHYSAINTRSFFPWYNLWGCHIIHSKAHSGHKYFIPRQSVSNCLIPLSLFWDKEPSPNF